MSYLYQRRCMVCNDIFSTKEITEEAFDANRYNMALEEGYKDGDWTLTIKSLCGKAECAEKKNGTDQYFR